HPLLALLRDRWVDSVGHYGFAPAATVPLAAVGVDVDCPAPGRTPPAKVNASIASVALTVGNVAGLSGVAKSTESTAKRRPLALRLCFLTRTSLRRSPRNLDTSPKPPCTI